jgi:hypothetical protein
VQSDSRGSWVDFIRDKEKRDEKEKTEKKLSKNTSEKPLF